MPTAQGPTVWLWVGAAAAGGDEITAATSLNGNWYVDQIDQDDGEIQGFWGGTIADSQTTLDVSAFLLGPPATDAEQAVQDYADDYPHGHDPEDAWWGNVYGFPDQALDVVAQLFPPAPVEPIETFAAQPHFGDDLATYIPLETEDYAAPPEQLEPLAPPEIVVPELAAAIELREQPWFPEVEFEDYDHSGEPNEWLAPPEIVVPELIAVQPHYGELPIPADETEDYTGDATLDVTPAFFPVPVEPIETFIAQPLAEQPWFPDQETEDYQGTHEQNETFAPPEVSLVELLAAQPHFGEWVWPEDQTEDYQSESSLDVSPQFFQVAAEPIETFAAQPHYGEWVWEDPQIEDYKSDVVLDVTAQFFGTVPDAELAANAQILEQPWFDQETEDYSTDPVLDVTPLFLVVTATITEIVPSYTTLHDLVDPPETLEDYQHTATLDVSGFLAGPFLGAGPVKGPTRKTALAGVQNATVELAGPNRDFNLSGDDVGLAGTGGLTFGELFITLGHTRATFGGDIPGASDPVRSVEIGSGANSVQEV